MLRALAWGRALATGVPGVTASAYAEALQHQIADFPADPATDEARWLPGALLRAAGEPGKAEVLWTAIAQGSPRWLDARLAVAELRWAAVESELFSGDRRLIVLAYQRADSFLTESAQQARNEREQAELLLAQARLNLVPIAGKAQLAVSLLERLGRPGLTPQERYRARLARMIALVQVGPPYLDAEREAQTHATWADPSARGAFFDAVRLIDQCASFSEVDLHQRRLGLVLRLLVQPVLQDPDDEKWTAEERSEIKLRLTRAYLFLGDERNCAYLVARMDRPSSLRPRRSAARPGRHLQQARGLRIRHRRAKAKIKKLANRVSFLVRGPVWAGAGLLPRRPPQGSGPAYRCHRNPAPGSWWGRTPEEINQAEATPGGAAVKGVQ